MPRTRSQAPNSPTPARSGTHGKRGAKTLTADARTIVGECIAGRARVLARSVSQFMEVELDGAGLTFPQFGLMARIAAAEDDTIGALAKRTGLDQSTLSRNLRVLEMQGFIEIAAIAEDQRKRAVWLTAHGARRLEAAVPAWRKGQAALAAKLDPRELEGAIGAVWKLRRAQTPK